MHAMDFYTLTCRCVMQADTDNSATLVELRRLVPCLRQALGCYVCFSILKNPMGPNHNVCRHSVCLNCLGGKLKLKPACSWCKDHCQFVPNPLLKTLVTCFKKLCVYIYNSHLGNVIKNSSVNGETNQLLQLLREGMDFQDDYVYTPPVSYPTVPVTVVQQSATSSSSANLTTEVTSSIEINPCDNVPVEEINLQNKCKTRPVKELFVPLVDVNTSKMCHNKRRMCAKISDHNYENKSHAKIKTKISKKPIIFLKRAALNRTKNKNTHMKSLVHAVKKKNNVRFTVKKFNKRLTKQEAPSDLEMIDNSKPLLQKVRVELQPPQLKPLSLCNCGKSGNFNQLTCIGQRCPCYSMKLPCVGCKCRGCRNPKKEPDYQGMNTIGSSAVLRSGTRNATEALQAC